MSSAQVSDCLLEFGPCRSYWSGHNMHFIHARHLGETPWGWRDGLVEAMDEDGWVAVRYLVGGDVGPGGGPSATVRVWHHSPLADLLDVGHPVRVHERYCALGGPFGWLNVAVRDGLGPVSEPASAELWEDEVTGGAVDLSTGRALPLDHADPPSG